MSADTTETVRLTADVVLIARHDDTPHVLLIQRGHAPFEGRWALPGGHVDPGEEVEAAGRRELAEEAGLDAAELDLVGVYSTPGRDPRGRYVTWAFVALLDQMPPPAAGDDARDARWFPLDAVLSGTGDPAVAFDHRTILSDAAALVQPTEWSTDAATCAAGCGVPVALGEPHYTVVRQAEVVEAGGTIQPLDGDELAHVHVDCWPDENTDVVIAATLGAPDRSTVRSAVTP